MGKLVKKMITWAMMVLVMVPSLALAQSRFPDVNEDSEYFVAVEFLARQGIIEGYPDGEFKPDRGINRAEAVKVVLLAREYLKEVGVEYADGEQFERKDYADVDREDWFYDFVTLATVEGIVEGYPDGEFKPEQRINAVESIKIILLSLDESYVGQELEESPFDDVDPDQWYAEFIGYAKEMRVIEGKDGNNFLPAREMSRGDFVEAIYRLMYALENGLDVYPPSAEWNFCNNYEEGYLAKYPENWKIISADNHLIYWKRDEKNGQVSFARIYPNSATLYFVVDENEAELELVDYLKQVDYGERAVTNFLELNGMNYATIAIENTGLTDNYFELPNGDILIVYGQVGSGSMSEELKEEVGYILGSIEPSEEPLEGEVCPISEYVGEESVEEVEKATEGERLRAALNQLVLVEGEGEGAMELVEDELLISTDSIGIGTGPVDYYYSQELDITIKYERESQTVLAIKNGKDDKF